MNTPPNDENSPNISAENLTKWVVRHLTSSTARKDLLQIIPVSAAMHEERRDTQKRKFDTLIKSEIQNTCEESVSIECSEQLMNNDLQGVESQSNCRCDEVIGILEKQEEYFKKMFNYLIDEVTSLRKEVYSLKRPKHSFDVSCLPVSPFETVEEFLTFEKSLQVDEAKCSDLKHELAKINVGDPEKYVRHVFKIFFDDKIAQQFCWRGTPEKQSVRELKFTSAVKCAFHEKFEQIDEDIFLQATMKHFQYAKDRLQKKVKYTSSKTISVAANSPI